MREAQLEARLRRLEDIEAIKQLKARYAAYCDDDYDAEGIAALFTEDGIWDGGPMGCYNGKQAIRDFFSTTNQVVPFAIHHVTNPLIEIDGDRATGRWYLWQPCTFAEGNQGLWMAATYDDVYRRDGDAWLFEHVTITLRVLSPYEDGWARTPMIGVPA
jgi:ketosteroid isomerase-like protein